MDRWVAGEEINFNGGAKNVEQPAVTITKCLAILANLDEWMQITADNQINGTNSWNFAVIDYIYDMSLMRRGIK